LPQTTLLTTPLHAAHVALSARMVDFGGWDMPVNYGSQMDEHHAVRKASGMFDVSHMQVVDLRGTGVRPFLRMVLANNIDKLKVAGKALYSCMLHAKGGVLDDLIVYYFGEEMFRLVVNAGTAEKDIAWLRAQLSAGNGADVTIQPRPDLAIIAVQGPQARERVWEVMPITHAATAEMKPFNGALFGDTAFGDVMLGRTGYTGEDGFEVVVAATQVNALWLALLERGVKPCGLGARDTLRLEAGMNLYGQDMDETISPLNAGLSWTVDLSTPRDFVGRSVLEQDGQSAALVGLILLEKGGVLRAHQKVHTEAGEGEITSGTFSPTMNQSIAFARVPKSVSVGSIAKVAIRDKLLEARVVKLPFVRNGKILAVA
jgi:aminomethyltransferase